MEKKILKKIPKNFKKLFAMAGEKCQCHNQRLTWINMLKHKQINHEEWLKNLTTTSDIKGKKIDYCQIRRGYHRQIEDMLKCSHDCKIKTDENAR